MTPQKEQKLKLFLANQLPENIIHIHNPEIYEFDFMWRDRNRGVLDTEWLHVCWLVEGTLDAGQMALYECRLVEITSESFNMQTQPVASMHYCDAPSGIRASWPQRATALAKMMGVEI